MLEQMLTRRLINNKFIGIRKFEKVPTNKYVLLAQSIEDYRMTIYMIRE